MTKLVILHIDDKEGDFQKGFPVSLKIREGDRTLGQKVDAFLPPNPKLLANYQLWQSPYLSLVCSLQSTRRITTTKVTEVSIPEIASARDQLKSSINNWLDSQDFMPVVHQLEQKLMNKSENILFIVNTKSSDLQKIPWHFWDFFEDHTQAEIALSFPVSKPKLIIPKDRVKILTVFGNNQTFGTKTKLEIEEDWQLLQQHLPDADFLPALQEPSLEKLHNLLCEENPDIFYYGGHSSIEPDGKTTLIYIRDDEQIEINDLIKALKKAGNRGLQLAIFNSCEGLGIARQLANSTIPHVIVMREPVPDEVARRFLEYFLKEFANGRSLYLAVREARERIGYLEKKFPGATCLPMIFQNPAELPYTWRQIRGISQSQEPQAANENTREESFSGSNQVVPPLYSPLSHLKPQTSSQPANNYIYCSICGNKNPHDANFCAECGSKISYMTANQKPDLDEEKYLITCPNCNRSNPNYFTQCKYCYTSFKNPTIITNIKPAKLPPVVLKTPSICPNTLDNDRYRIIQTLGSGGFGDTFLAEDIQMPSGRRCVIKQLRPVMNNPQIYKLVQERFQREAAILEELGQGNSQIPRLYASFIEDGEFYLVQEWIEGETLSQKVTKSGRLSESSVKEILVNILPVLDYVHSKRIVHRDVKPDNIILRHRDGQPVLIDFGAVRETMGTVMNTGGNATSSIVIGTPAYMPSEQSAGRPVYSSDLYSLGLTAVYLLTGKMPQELETNYNTGEIVWHCHALNVSPTLAAIIDKAIQSHPRDRYSTAKEMLNALHSGLVPTLIPTPSLTVVSTNSSSGYSQPNTQVSPPPGVYQQPVYFYPAPPNQSLSDWQKAVIMGGVIGACVAGGLWLTQPKYEPIVPPSASPNSSLQKSSP